MTAPAQRRANRLMIVALIAIGLVWLAGCAWSFEEQTRFAESKAFQLPWLLPLVIDGLAAAMATVATAASLDGRPAISARLVTALAVAASATSNAAAAWERELGDPAAVTMAAGVPVAANLAFEVLLAEIRRQVQRRRGQPPPAAVSYPRLIRVALAPVDTLREWRREALTATTQPATPDGAPADRPAVAPHRTGPERPTAAPVRSLRATPEPVNGRPTHQSGQPAAVATTPAVHPRPGAGTDPDPRVGQLVEMLRAGHDLTGQRVGERFACSARTGRRLLRRAEELHQSRPSPRVDATPRRPEPSDRHEMIPAGRLT